MRGAQERAPSVVTGNLYLIIHAQPNKRNTDTLKNGTVMTSRAGPWFALFQYWLLVLPLCARKNRVG